MFFGRLRKAEAGSTDVKQKNVGWRSQLVGKLVETIGDWTGLIDFKYLSQLTVQVRASIKKKIPELTENSDAKEIILTGDETPYSRLLVQAYNLCIAIEKKDIRSMKAYIEALTQRYNRQIESKEEKEAVETISGVISKFLQNTNQTKRNQSTRKILLDTISYFKRMAESYELWEEIGEFFAFKTNEEHKKKIAEFNEQLEAIRERLKKYGDSQFVRSGENVSHDYQRVEDLEKDLEILRNISKTRRLIKRLSALSEVGAEKLKDFQKMQLIDKSAVESYHLFYEENREELIHLKKNLQISILNFLLKQADEMRNQYQCFEEKKATYTAEEEMEHLSVCVEGFKNALNCINRFMRLFPENKEVLGRDKDEISATLQLINNKNNGLRMSQ